MRKFTAEESSAQKLEVRGKGRSHGDVTIKPV